MYINVMYYWYISILIRQFPNHINTYYKYFINSIFLLYIL